MKRTILTILKYGALVLVPFLGMALVVRPLWRVTQDYRHRASAHAELRQAYQIAIDRLQDEVAEIRSAGRNRLMTNSNAKIAWRLDEIERYKKRIEYENQLTAKYSKAAWTPWSAPEPDPPAPTDEPVRTAKR